MKSGIYIIVNPLGKVYIGQSTNIDQRLRRYKGGLCKGQTKIYNSINKYGWQKHSFDILELCHEGKLNERELFYSKKYDSTGVNGLNIRECGGSKGRLSQETKRKISEANIGKSPTKETRDKISNSLKGHTPHNKGVKGKQVAWNKGLPQTEDVKEKLRVANLGKVGKDSNAKVILQIKDNNVINKYFGAREVERLTGYKCAVINRAARGERQTAYGYNWKYE